MQNSTLSVVVASLAMSLMTGCSHAPLSKTFNEANANNIAVQTVNPNAGKGDEPIATLDGQKSERLLQRYRVDTGKASSDTLVSK